MLESEDCLQGQSTNSNVMRHLPIIEQTRTDAIIRCRSFHGLFTLFSQLFQLIQIATPLWPPIGDHLFGHQLIDTF